jgi:hypothetical protein
MSTLNIMEEVINLNLNDSTEINLDNLEATTIDNSIVTESKSVLESSFGGGIELLMNDKKKEKSQSSTSVDLSDISALENDLNSLSEDTKSQKNISKSDLFSNNINISESKIKIDDNVKEIGFDKKEPVISIGKATVESSETKTWDGFSNLSQVPVHDNAAPPSKESKTREEILQGKFKYVKLLDELEKKGVRLTKKYSMESSLQEMQGEYETIIAEKERKNSTKFQGRILTALITGVEFLNNKFDPFDIKLDGWSEQLNENLDDYDEIFAELHEKYKSKAKMAPEIKLLFQLGASAMMVHMTNTMFKSSMPGMDDIMRQNPELMQHFTQAAVNTMGETNPGFSGFMNEYMDNNNNNNTRMPDSRPDLNQTFSNNRQRPSSQQNERPEMGGPSDLGDILSGLKTKSVDVQDKSESTISVEDAIKMKQSNVPKSTKRKKSDKNVVSLDL